MCRIGVRRALGGSPNPCVDGVAFPGQGFVGLGQPRSLRDREAATHALDLCFCEEDSGVCVCEFVCKREKDEWYWWHGEGEGIFGSRSRVASYLKGIES